MKHTYRVLALSFLISLPAHACLNDRDSDKLEKEVEAGKPGLPDVMRVITGRFERNPPLFYEMRLKRVAAEIEKTPQNLSLYDDAAVACDRLHRDDEALQWMKKKRALLEKQKPVAQLSTHNVEDKRLREAWYRYYANAGTFHAHHWLGSGAKRAQIAEMKTAAQMITRAIQIKPNAHFGREKYQLMAMQWIINPPRGWNVPSPLPNFLNVYPIRTGLNTNTNDIRDAKYVELYETEGTLQKYHLEDAVEGIVGLIVLGAAWESLDAFNALRVPLDLGGKASLSDLAKLRMLELVRSGKHSLYPQNVSSNDLMESIAPSREVRPRSYTPQQIQEIYTRLRNEAEEYQKNRTAYMMARLEKGQHPDTDPNFWNEWHDAGPPAPVPYTFWEKRGTPITILAAALLLSLGALTMKQRRRKA